MYRKVAVIRKCKKKDQEPGKPWCLYSKDGKKLLGRHKTKADAEAQEAAIQISKHGFNHQAQFPHSVKIFDLISETKLKQLLKQVPLHDTARAEAVNLVSFSDMWDAEMFIEELEREGIHADFAIGRSIGTNVYLCQAIRAIQSQ